MEESRTFSININDDEEEQADSIIFITLLSEHEYEVDYCQLFKYSRLIKDKYPFDKAKNELTPFFQSVQSEYNINEKSFIQFFSLIQEKNIYLNIENCIDLWKISKIFKVKKLQTLILKYSKNYQKDVDFLSILLLNQESEYNHALVQELSINIEEILLDEIEKCFQSEYFGKLPISVIYRLIDKSDKKKISSDSLYKFIRESIKERCILFTFLDLQTLSNELFNELSQFLRENDGQEFTGYFKYDFDFINSLKEDKAELQRRLRIMIDKNQQLDSQKNELINLNSNITTKASAYSDYIDSIEYESFEKSKKEEKLKSLIEYKNSMRHRLDFTKFKADEIDDKKDFKGILKII